MSSASLQILNTVLNSLQFVLTALTPVLIVLIKRWLKADLKTETTLQTAKLKKSQTKHMNRMHEQIKTSGLKSSGSQSSDPPMLVSDSPKSMQNIPL